MPEEAITVEHLSKFYGNQAALDEVAFKVSKGSCVGYLGPNGSGKSTTIRIMTSLAKSSRGKIHIFGHDVDTEQKKALFNAGAIVETPAFPSYLSPAEVLKFLGQLRGMREGDYLARIDEVLELVRMKEWKNKSIGGFSKGMTQRVALAGALLHDPELLILDEPTSGLDPMGMTDMRNIFKSIIKSGKTVFSARTLSTK